ncbi:MBL fold metallo-hydrolase RNA specificity domain-containing protein [Oryzobacter sp. R7]|uniref:MBL fold metallo-hydrolase RNA specificity domain-containing protein n=1 Tax=Oryzobacter faecalis TaxID=3388656 RepID=UPI00398C8B1E
MPSPTLTFWGAAGTVTGSRFLVETAASRVLVDAGLHQGPRELRRLDREGIPLDATALDGVVLTHAHLDHCGYLPRLVRDGLDAPVLCTDGTAELAAIVLRDSAHLQEEDAAYAAESGYSLHATPLPLYDRADAERTIPLLRPVPLHDPVPLTDDVTVVLRSAGHILGASTALVEAAGARVLFSGDLGRPHHPLVPPREDPPAADVVVVESTYGDRRHPDPATAPPGGVLADAVRRTVARGGSVLVPAFAIDRTELVLLRLGELMAQGLVPTVPVFVDSPMALAALDVYRRVLGRLDPGVLPPAWDAETFGVPDLRTVRSAAESQALNDPRRPCVVVSASGMATGGRVVHHLAHQLPDPRHCVVLTGYQAAGTRGRDLLEGARQLKMHGRYVPVRAEVVHDPSFSVHADADELVAWLARCPEPPMTVFVVHGEPPASEALSARVADELGWCAVVPRLGERVRLDRPDRPGAGGLSRPG